MNCRNIMVKGCKLIPTKISTIQDPKFHNLFQIHSVGRKCIGTWINIPCGSSHYLRVQIITLHYASCEVNSSYCDCKVVNFIKIVKQFFSQGKFNSSKLYFPHYILILLIQLILLSKEILLIPRITP